MLSHVEVLAWLRETDPARLATLWAMADAVRVEHVGPAVHLRGLLELSNHCVRECGYCGLRAGHTALRRYRLTAAEIRTAARQAIRFGYGTLVLQAGEDLGLEATWLAERIRQIKAETGLAVTLSLGERADAELALWRRAGADRYLLRFETSDPALYRRIHPDRGGVVSDRLALLGRLRRLGYEIGGGMMVGLPGQSWGSLADDLLLCRRLDLDMIGLGPYLPHPATPLGRGEWSRPLPAGAQVPATEAVVYRALALARLLCPEANLPSTTALATLNRAQGRELGLARGANVVMPNLTPAPYRALYEIYPGKACVGETAEACTGCLGGRIAALGRTLGTGPGGRRRGTREATPEALPLPVPPPNLLSTPAPTAWRPL